jgi:hypothetical protein
MGFHRIWKQAQAEMRIAAGQTERTAKKKKKKNKQEKANIKTERTTKKQQARTSKHI